MTSILESCAPRRDLVAGTFNPEVFTANLTQVIDHYRGASDVVENLYTDPLLFFTQGTYATAGMRQVLRNLFGRLRGRDATYPAIQRLETAFGGGKTHTLTLMFTHRSRDAWETLTRSLIEAGWIITASFPVQFKSTQFWDTLQDVVLASTELRLTAHVAAIESDNERSGRAQAALALGTAFGLITSRQRAGHAEENFWQQLDVLRRLRGPRWRGGR